MVHWIQAHLHDSTADRYFGEPQLQAVKILRQIPSIGPLRAALMQAPHRFRSKQQLWTYSGLAVETHDSVRSIVTWTTAIFHRRAI
jgi:transposase